MDIGWFIGSGLCNKWKFLAVGFADKLSNLQGSNIGCCEFWLKHLNSRQTEAEPERYLHQNWHFAEYSAGAIAIKWSCCQFYRSKCSWNRRRATNGKLRISAINRNSLENIYFFFGTWHKSVSLEVREREIFFNKSEFSAKWSKSISFK